MRPRGGLAFAASLLLVGLLSAVARAQEAPPLAQLELDIVGIRLVVDPPVLTVPKDIPTKVNAELVLPLNGATNGAAAIAKLAAGAVVEAELRGPFIDPVRLAVRPGQPLPIPPLALPGDYFLDQIRLVKDGQVILNGSPATVAIKVISEVFVTSVTSRPLSLEEIRERGIVIDDSSFQAVNFTLGFVIDGKPFAINLPVALPSQALLQFEKRPDVLLAQLTAINRRLAETVKLPPEFDRPGLDFAIAGLPFIPVDEEGEPRLFGPPPITGLLVIPGNVAFLNQMFSVLLMVMNVAPDGSLLVLRDVEGRITLPPGLDRVSGTPDAPGDDPLRLARIQGIGAQPMVRVVRVGPDGKLGTADDIPRLTPGTQGQGEFLVEGLREGGHLIDIAINAVMDGLPSGPVRLLGKAAGAVFVRNPTFSITLAHPRTVRSGERYDLYATVTNTSLTVANLVSVNLDRRSVSGAQLASDETVEFPTIAPGQSATARFTLVSQQTGEVTFSSFTSDPGLTGRFQLRTGIGERGIPLAPNAIVLPRTVDGLPDTLVAAAQRVLGQAFSISTAPAEALPPDVLYVTRQTVITRGRELGEAGQRLQFGEPLARVVPDLLLDWLGGRAANDGFDQLLRTTDAGAAFRAEVGKILGEAVASSSVLEHQQSFGTVTAPRTGHLSAITGLGPGTAPVRLRIFDEGGRPAGIGPAGPEQDLPFAGLVPLADAGGRSDLVVVSRPEASPYTVEVRGTGAGHFDLGILVPGDPGALTQLRYENVAIGNGGVARVVVVPSGGGVPLLEVDADGDGRRDRTVSPVSVAIVEGPAACALGPPARALVRYRVAPPRPGVVRPHGGRPLRQAGRGGERGVARPLRGAREHGGGRRPPAERATGVPHARQADRHARRAHAGGDRRGRRARAAADAGHAPDPDRVVRRWARLRPGSRRRRPASPGRPAGARARRR